MEINVLEATGLVTDPNQLSSVKAGSLRDCVNVSCDKTNIYEKTRGYKQYATLSGMLKKFFNFQNRNIAYYLKNNTTPTLAHDVAGSFVDYGPVTSTYPMFSTSALNNFYFTSDDGIKKLDSVTGNIMNAGVPQGLGGLPTLIDTTPTSQILQTAHRLAYRIVWGYVDANNNLILGAPSPRIPVLNQSGVTKDISLNLQIPDQITTTQYFYQVYRSEEVVDTTIPLDEMYLVNQVTLTPLDLTNGFVTFVDHVSIDDTGATIYTADSQLGLQNSFYQPPMAKDLGTFEGTTFYANTKTKQIITLTLKLVQSTGFGFFNANGDTTTGSFIVSNATGTSNVRVGQSISGPGIPVGTTVLGKTSNSITLSQAATATAIGVALVVRDFVQIGSEIYYASDANDATLSYFNVDTDIETATINLTNLINDISPDYNAYYLGVGDIEKGLFEIEALTFAHAAFTVNASLPTAFISNLPQTSQNEKGGNRLYLSLPDKPESVPFDNWVPVGTLEFEIERVIFLRDSFFIFKSDGSVYRGVGFTMENISIRRFNEHAKLRGIDLPAILDNNIFCFCDQGVTIVNDNGIVNASKNKIERTLFAISKVRNTSFETVSFGIGYETDSKYILFVTTNPTDTVATQAFVFNIVTGSWTRWKRNVAFGYWNVGEDRLYIGTEIIRQERKDYNETDFSEDEIDVTITDVSGKLVTISSVAGVSIGWSIYQNGIKSKIQSIAGNVLTLTQEVLLVNGAAKVYQPMEFSFTYVPQGYKNLIDTKHHQELFHYVQNNNYESFDQTITNEDTLSPQTHSVVPKTEGLPLQPIRTLIPKNQTRSRWLNITISQAEACTNLEYLGYTLMGESVSERSK